jgi:DNA-binding MarR family transcriptional regulator
VSTQAKKRAGGGGASSVGNGQSGLAHELHKRGPFQSAAQEAFLNVMRTASMLSGDFERLFKHHGLSSATYNALRILRGAGDQGRRCTEIGEHLVAVVPDVTRLVDRLEEAGLVKRSRGGKEGNGGGGGGKGNGAGDRRVVIVRITPAGLALLKKLDQPVLDLHQQLMGHMSRKELGKLSELLCKAREGLAAAD